MTESTCEQQRIKLIVELLAASNLPMQLTEASAPRYPVVFVNDAFVLMTGYSSFESLGQNSRFLEIDDNEQPGAQQLSKALHEGLSFTGTMRNYKKDKSLFWNDLSVYPIKNPAGTITHFISVHNDVTIARKARIDLLDANATIECSSDFYVESTADGELLSANCSARELLGIESQMLEGIGWRKLGRQDFLHVNFQNLDFVLFHNPVVPNRFVRQYHKLDGKAIEIEWNVTRRCVSGNLLAIGRDVTAERVSGARIQSNVEKVNALLDGIAEGCISVTRDWRLTYINGASARWIGKSKDYLLGKTIWDVAPEAIDGIFSETFLKAMANRTIEHCEDFYSPTGRWISARIYPSNEGLTIFFADTTDRKRKEERLLYAASYDHLTGLLNRETCLQKIKNKLALTGEARLGSLAVLLFDLDKFKEVNDSAGHQVGDHVLRLLGARFKALSNESRYCARLSGDAFLFVLYPCTASSAQIFARRLIDEIVQPFHVASQQMVIGASVGVAAVAEDEMISVSDLINNADTAMYAAKASGRLAVRVFDTVAAQASRQRLQLRGEMASAIESGQFRLHYQPQVRLRDGVICGVEALIRWNHPSFGLLSPAVFLDIAEESPLILQLGAWVCEEACRQLAQWAALGHPLYIAINVSARQLIDPNFPQLLRQSVIKHKVNPKCIELEITESMLSQDFSVTASMLSELAQQGFRIALDDFGTGYSNLVYINRFPIKVLKIDRSFVANIDSDAKALDLVKGITALGKSLNMEIICEGVETLGQRLLIEETQCDVIQGYLISKPLPHDELQSKFLDNIH